MVRTGERNPGQHLHTKAKTVIKKEGMGALPGVEKACPKAH